ncbi:ataxin-1-like isoform X2 [Halyomorpha halys]|uniref:ataxin-1-like isoform X2 n=1 Tax=Halyomorpha halys TaxID=286706 RepID=UPI0006D4FCE9|nr:ataxin-1-like isoform X2 [Halyomorpha halys]
MISPSLAVEGGYLGFPSVPEFLRPLPPRFRPPPAARPPLPHKEEEDFQPYRVYNPYYNPYLYPYHIRPVDLYSPPQSPLRPKVPPGPQPPATAPPAPQAGGGPPTGSRRLRRTRPTRAAGFARGSLIRLANGDLRRVEEMRTEDFISSAETCPALRLDPSTVVRIEASHDSNLAVLTLRYGESRAQVEVESSVDHPYFVYGQGWASCRPEQTMATYGLKCHLLQVGDVCISLSPRPPGSDRKRRWSAPDQLPDPEQPADLHKPRTLAASPP